ncbi:MAG: fumarate reductase subunit FrdD [Burkholderiaceae bacterium]|nr:fumarate reductase subunit FrdD [Burkholderiaceae bacterium]
MKRSVEPVTWLLFGAGGMLSALIAPVLVLITGLLVPLGVLPGHIMSYPRMLALAQHPLGKLLLLAVISLFLFHGCHRVVTTLHDYGLRGGHAAMALFFGAAALLTLLAAGLLIAIGF